MLNINQANIVISYNYHFILFIKQLEYYDLKILRFAYLYLSVYICINNKIEGHDTI